MTAVRPSGVVAQTTDLGPEAHVCWGFGRWPEFRAAAVEYLADGIAAGFWIELVGGPPVVALREAAIALGRAPEGVGVQTVRDFYCVRPGTDIVDAAATLEARLAEGAAILDAGYPGYRAIIDCTSMVRTPGQWSAFAEWEHMADRVMSDLPFSALCAYDVSALHPDAIAAVHCVHPLGNRLQPLFRLHALPGGGLALAGEVDLSCAELFESTLARLDGHLPNPLRLDCRDLEYIDHHGLEVLERLGAERGRDVTLVGTPVGVSRLVELLGLRRVDAT